MRKEYALEKIRNFKTFDDAMKYATNCAVDVMVTHKPNEYKVHE